MTASMCIAGVWVEQKKKKKKKILTYQPIFFQACYSKHNFFFGLSIFLLNGLFLSFLSCMSPFPILELSGF